MRLAIIGGGPAGFFGAITAAQKRPSEIVLFEASQQVLSKVRISGGGRCNVTHSCFDPAELVKNYPRGFKELRGAFSRFQPRDTIAWFKKRGVILKAEEDGRMFPATDDSETIVDCLVESARGAGIEVRTKSRITGAKIIDFEKGRRRFELSIGRENRGSFDRLLLATGSNERGYEIARLMGHEIMAPVPSLFTFEIPDKRLEGLSGLSFKALQLVLKVGEKRLKQVGPMLITHWGLSGPAVLKLSAWGARWLHESNYQANLTINFIPERTKEQISHTFQSYRRKHGRKEVGGESPFPVPRRYWQRLVQMSGIPKEQKWSNLTREAESYLLGQLTNAEFAITGKGIFKDEFVTCGGVSLKGIDFKSMQSRIVPGLFMAGEILDIDGITGGFNFQSAWTTGWLAGKAMAGS
ncbi:conserved hypothetical protein [Candidatus Zixiibacteriota bacterium]|nr:conserved hypothetical protein [candidate division Zixibacteria bacterium]